MNGLRAKFVSCLDPAGDMRYAATFTNEQGHSEGSVEYSQATAHISAEMEPEKKAKVAASKQARLTF